jgi:hypothetical protein
MNRTFKLISIMCGRAQKTARIAQRRSNRHHPSSLQIPLLFLASRGIYQPSGFRARPVAGFKVLPHYVPLIC